jgi:beta-galactosidase
MLKNILSVLWLLSLIIGVLPAQNEIYRPSLNDREKVSIDFNWLFFPGDINGEEETHQVNRRPWQHINLPHEWSIEGPFSEEHNTTQGFMPMGIGWYKKGLRFPESYEGKKIYIIFDGVYRESDVWMNYAYIGHHTSGYSSFAYDISDYVQIGRRIPNSLRVRVDARRHEQDMYEGSGIYRHTWILVTNKLHVANWGTFISTPKVSKKSAAIKIETKINNDYAETKKFRLNTIIVNAKGYIVAKISNEYSLAAGAEKEFIQKTEVSEPELWELDFPYLYKAYSEIELAGETVDVYETRFGIRSFYFDAQKGFFLNGKHIKLRGFCGHYDMPALGTALPDRMQRDQMTAMKKTGFNLYRSSHNPATPERLDFCDEIGMLVWDECERKLESKEVELPLVKSTIIRDRNHPAVILWSLENESPLESTVFGADIIQAATQLAHRLDPTRPTTFAASMPVNENGYGAAADVVSYNYHWRRADQDHLDFPDWKMGLISEYSAKKTRRAVYGINPEFNMFDGEIQNIYQACISVEGYWKRIRARDWLGGGCLWAGIDYWGEGTLWPLVRSGYGIIDMCMTPKDQYYYFASLWTEKPMIHIFPHWTWPGKEGQKIKVWLYTNCDEVELFLNGRSLGVKKRQLDLTPYKAVAFKDLLPEERDYRYFERPDSYDKIQEHLEWVVAYEPGTLRAVGKRKGSVVLTEEVKTAGKPAKIVLQKYMAPYLSESEIEPFTADGRDVMMIKAAVLDKNGVLVPDAHNLIEFTVEGGAKLVGTGNGDLPDHNNVKSSSCNAFNGYCVAVIRSANTAGKIIVRAKSQGLQTGSIKVEALPAEAKAIKIIPKPYIPIVAGIKTTIIATMIDKFASPVLSGSAEIELNINGAALFANGSKIIKSKLSGGKAEVGIKYLAAGEVTITANEKNGLKGRMKIIVK